MMPKYAKFIKVLDSVIDLTALCKLSGQNKVSFKRLLEYLQSGKLATSPKVDKAIAVLENVFIEFICDEKFSVLTTMAMAGVRFREDEHLEYVDGKIYRCFNSQKTLIEKDSAQCRLLYYDIFGVQKQKTNG